MRQVTPRLDKKLFATLWGAFIVQILGRLLDLQWHRTHSEFESGGDQFEAHWLVWLGTLLIGTSVIALRSVGQGQQRVGYVVTLWANGLYALAAVVHFIQHTNNSEIDWTHLTLGVTNLVAAAGVLIVTTAYLRDRSRPPIATS